MQHEAALHSNDINALRSFFHEEVSKRDLALQQAKARIAYLEEMVRLFQRKKFSPSSEQNPNQLTLFNEAEDSSDVVVKPKTKVPEHNRNRAKRQPLPEALPRIDQVHDLADPEKICDCGSMLKEMGEEVSEQLDIIPPQVQVIRHRRKKYSCPSCQSCIRTAKKLSQALPKSNASAACLHMLPQLNMSMPCHCIGRKIFFVV